MKCPTCGAFPVDASSLAPVAPRHVRRRCLCQHADSSHGTADGNPGCRFCACAGFRWEAGKALAPVAGVPDLEQVKASISQWIDECWVASVELAARDRVAPPSGAQGK